MLRQLSLSALLLTWLAASCPGDVLIYDGRGSIQVTARGGVGSAGWKEFYLIEPETRRTVTVEHRVKGFHKTFRITQPEVVALFTVRGEGGQSFTVIPSTNEASASTPIAFLLTKGLNQHLDIGAEKSRHFPEALTGIVRGAGVHEESNFLTTGKASLKLNRELTVRANKAGDSFEAALQRIVTHLRNYGYYEEDPS